MTSRTLRDRDTFTKSNVGWWQKDGVSQVAGLLCAAVLALVPLITQLFEQPYYLSLASRILIMGLAASGLNLVLSYGGMVSFGHALYVGAGAYAVGILSRYGVTNGFIQLAVAMSAGAVIATIVGVVCLRARGIAFIMITLAFAQMAYVLAVGIKTFGGEDGFQVAARTRFPGVDLDRAADLYYICLCALLVVLVFSSRLMKSRFGRVVRGAKSNEDRMLALGYNTLRFKLIAYVISALICVVSGMLLANLTNFVSPSFMQWTASGELIIMILLGGMGTIIGPAIGAAIILGFEECFSNFHLGLSHEFDDFISQHWMLFLGLFIIAVTLFLKRGLYGSLFPRNVA